MPKTTTTKRAFKIVDLIRKRESFEYIDVPSFPVEVVIEVTTSGRVTTPKPAPSAVFDQQLNASAIFTEGAGLISNIKTVYSLVSNVAEAVS